jgi:hypothetical protein
VQKKKKPQKKKSQPSPELSAGEKAFLDVLNNTEPGKRDFSLIHELLSDPGRAAILIEKLPLESAATPEVLASFSKAFPQKEVQKAIRKSLFKLKQKGVPVPELDTESEPGSVPTRPEREKARAYVGPIDGTGSRAVFIGVPQIPQGHDLGMGLINDTQGIVEFVFGRYSRKQAKEVQELFFEKVPSMVETTLAHAAALLEKAHRLKSGQGESSGHYLRLRPWLLGHAEPLDKPKVYEHLSPDEVHQEALTEAQVQRLLAHEHMASWIVDPEKLTSVIEEINEVEQSRILISEIQKVERINQVKQASIAKLYPEGERAVIKQRLEEMAYLFLKSGEEPYGRLAAACAMSLDEKDSFIKVNPYLSALLEKSLALYFQAEKGHDPTRPSGPPSSRIILR